MRTIHKYELMPIDYQSVEMPKDAEILSLGMRGSVITMWVAENTKEDTTVRRFAMFKTGEDLPAGLHKYMTTLNTLSGDIHVFEKF